jgi:signal transduction histidine kinase
MENRFLSNDSLLLTFPMPESALPPSHAKAFPSKVFTDMRQAVLQPAQQGVASLPPPFAGRERQLVLIVDDETAMRDILNMHLQSSFDVITARNGQEGMEMALAHLPDLILSDIRMPVKTGFELCRDLRATLETQDIPIVMLTATDDRAMKLDCLRAGATDFLSKPCTAAELVLRVRNLAKMHRQQQELSSQKQRLELALSELQKKDELLVRQERLAALGRMSAGLIHEINNPLNYAIQGLHLLKSQLPTLPTDSAAEFSEVLQDINDGVHRVTRIVADLRGFASSSKSKERQPTALLGLVESVLKYLSHAGQRGYETQIEIPPALAILADRNQMLQVLTNLIKNAMDAMEAKTYADDDGPRLIVRASLEDRRVRLILRDNGVGMSAAVREHVFEPFFTTKDVGGGMGLGLSICHSILLEHGAVVDVQSVPGEFTEFSLEFPADEESLAIQPTDDDAPQ